MFFIPTASISTRPRRSAVVAGNARTLAGQCETVNQPVSFRDTSDNRLQNLGETPVSASVIDAGSGSIGGNLPPRVGRAALSTVPAKSSFEERQYELVRRGLMSIEDARARVEGYRERRRLSVARFVGGAA